LEDLFWKVSDPKGEMYGQYMDLKEIGKMIQPSEETFMAIINWLNENGVYDYTTVPHKDWVNVQVTHAIAKKLLNVEFRLFQHQENGDIIARAVEDIYTVSNEIADKIDFIGGVHRFPKTLRVGSSNLNERNVESTELVSVDPNMIKTAYNISSYTSSNWNNSQAVASFLGQYFSASDLTKFQEKYDLPQVPISRIVGGDSGRTGVEANLDVQYITGVGTGTPTWSVFTGGYNNTGQEPFLTWIQDMMALGNSPWIHSVSYGDVESSISLSYADRLNVEFQKFGVSGRTVFIAAGDDGTSCTDSCDAFIPDWPTSSPYITSVGGTDPNSKTSPWNVWPDGGGGFSNYYSQPSYQSNAVSEYLQSSAAPPTSFFNSSGRAYPDVAAFANNVQVEYMGSPIPVAGTSCATPITAGLFSLVNDYRLKNGYPTLGFLNPFLYNLYDSNELNGFFDVVSGNNKAGCCKSGFDATTGWDGASGLGSINFGNMKELSISQVKFTPKKQN